MNVRDVMARIVHRAKKDDKVGDVANTMKQEDIGFVPVVDGEKLIGATYAASWIHLVLDERFNRRGAYFIPEGSLDWEAAYFRMWRI